MFSEVAFPKGYLLNIGIFPESARKTLFESKLKNKTVEPPTQRLGLVSDK
jgi:hypothetical protein